MDSDDENMDAPLTRKRRTVSSESSHSSHSSVTAHKTVKMNFSQACAMKAVTGNTNGRQSRSNLSRQSRVRPSEVFHHSIDVGKAMCVETVCDGSPQHQPSAPVEVGFCSLQCASMLGVAPTMYCSMCMVAVHPQCVHLDPSDEYVCQVCKQTCADPPTSGDDEDEMKNRGEKREKKQIKQESEECGREDRIGKREKEKREKEDKEKRTKEKREKEEMEKREKEKREKEDKEKREKEKREKEEMEKREKEKREKEEMEKREKERSEKRDKEERAIREQHRGVEDSRLDEHRRSSRVTRKKGTSIALPIVIMPEGTEENDAAAIELSPPQPQQVIIQPERLQASNSTPNRNKSKKKPTYVRSCPRVGSIQVLEAGFCSLMHILSYLPAPDLFRASRVCRLWHSMTIHALLRRSLLLHGCFVSDWCRLSEYILEHNVQKLDLRGLVGEKNGRNTWRLLPGSLGMLRPLREVHLGTCPGEVLSHVIDKCPDLRVLSAVFVNSIKDNAGGPQPAIIDLTKLDTLSSIKTLHLQSSHGLQTRADSPESVNLPSSLQSLILTTWKMKECSVIKFNNMPNLTSLQFGECLTWKEEHYKALSGLKQLSSLRLENGQDTYQNGLAYSLKHLKSLKTLELIRFNVSLRLVTVLQGVDHLDEFRIWPDTYAVDMPFVNACCLTSISQMGFLKRFEWGVITNSPMADSKAIPFFGWSANHGSWKAMFDPGAQCDLVSVDDLANKVCRFLPDTTTRVFRVPRATSFYPKEGNSQTIAQFRSAAGLD